MTATAISITARPRTTVPEAVIATITTTDTVRAHPAETTDVATITTTTTTDITTAVINRVFRIYSKV